MKMHFDKISNKKCTFYFPSLCLLNLYNCTGRYISENTELQSYKELDKVQS